MNDSRLGAWGVACARLCVVLALLPVTAGAVGAQSLQGRGGRGHTGSKNALEINGMLVAFGWGFQGGYATADVVTEPSGLDRFPHKHLAGVKYEDISLNADPAEVAGLVNDALAKDHPVNGKVMTLDYNNKAVEETDFFNALVTGFELPPLDAASKEACYVTLTLFPEFTKHVATPAGTAIGGPGTKEEKKCLSSNFEVSISGLEDATKQVSHIEGIAATQKVVEQMVGERAHETASGHWNFSNVSLTVPESQEKKFADWLDDFVVKGNNGHGKEKTMTVKLFAPDRTTLLTLTASGVGIFKLTPEKVEAGSENIRRIQAEVYVTKWEIAK